MGWRCEREIRRAVSFEPREDVLRERLGDEFEGVGVADEYYPTGPVEHVTKHWSAHGLAGVALLIAIQVDIRARG